MSGDDRHVDHVWRDVLAAKFDGQQEQLRQLPPPTEIFSLFARIDVTVVGPYLRRSTPPEPAQHLISLAWRHHDLGDGISYQGVFVRCSTCLTEAVHPAVIAHGDTVLMNVILVLNLVDVHPWLLTRINSIDTIAPKYWPTICQYGSCLRATCANSRLIWL